VIYVHHLRNELMNQGHRVSVFTGRIGRTNRDPGIHLVKATAKYRIVRKLSGLFRGDSYHVSNWGKAIGAKVNEVNQTDPIDVLEMEESFGWCADVQKLVPIPVVVKLHGPAFLTLIEEARQTETARARIEVEGNGLRQIVAIVSPSQSTLLDTVSRYDLHPPIRRVIPNPVIVEAGVEPWNLEGCDRKTILFVGRFDKLKGGDTMLIAFRRLLEIDHSLKLIFVGPDRGLTSAGGSPVAFNEFRNSLFTEAQRPSISYLGQLPRTDIFELRRKAMLTIVVSRWENQPNAVLEAMIQGCPIVASDTGGMSEIIQNEITGFLARRDDIDDLCRKIMRLLNEPARARWMGENARQLVTERNSVQKLAKETVDLYCQVISIAKGRKFD
jgi:glycosyltransferase involved in cell wall biosynthesis